MTDTSTEAVELIRKYVDYPYTSPNTVILDSDLVTLTAQDLADLLQERDQFKAQLTEARAQVAVAYEVAAKAVEPYYNDLDGNRVPILGSPYAKAIRALTPDHTTTALEQIKQQARDEGKREAAEAAGVLLPENGAGQACDDTDRLIDTVRRECVAAILATLSADTSTT